MNRTTVSIVLAISFLLVACGNKGELYLEADQAITDEIKQLDESLDQLDGIDTAEDESVVPSDTDTDAEAKKAKKKSDKILQSAE